MKGNVLYLPSTPLNVLVSCAVASHYASDCKAEIWLIDQKDSESNPYYQALSNWSDSPFQRVQIFPGCASGKQKWLERKANFEVMEESLKNFVPQTVATGSDRRIEFQYVMNLLTQKNKGVMPKGVYLDDGLYSYAGRPYSFLKDSVNALLKKLSYGFWWREPKTVGASSWIEQAWLFEPGLAVEALQSKKLNKLSSGWFNCERIVSFSRILAIVLKFEIDRLNDLDVLILIPHPNNIKKIPGYRNRVVELVERLSRSNKKVGVKYHPRSEGHDALDLLLYGAQVVIPTQLAFEFCLPVFKPGCKIVGDVGTTMLTAKWLRSDLDVKAVLDSGNVFQKTFIPLMKEMEINVIPSVEELLDEARI